LAEVESEAAGVARRQKEKHPWDGAAYITERDSVQDFSRLNAPC
jgi:hypothetical protein